MIVLATRLGVLRLLPTSQTNHGLTKGFTGRDLSALDKSSSQLFDE